MYKDSKDRNEVAKNHLLKAHRLQRWILTVALQPCLKLPIAHLLLRAVLSGIRNKSFSGTRKIYFGHFLNRLALRDNDNRRFFPPGYMRENKSTAFNIMDPKKPDLRPLHNTIDSFFVIVVVLLLWVIIVTALLFSRSAIKILDLFSEMRLITNILRNFVYHAQYHLYMHLIKHYQEQQRNVRLTNDMRL